MSQLLKRVIRRLRWDRNPNVFSSHHVLCVCVSGGGHQLPALTFSCQITGQVVKFADRNNPGFIHNCVFLWRLYQTIFCFFLTICKMEMSIVKFTSDILYDIWLLLGPVSVWTLEFSSIILVWVDMSSLPTEYLRISLFLVSHLHADFGPKITISLLCPITRKLNCKSLWSVKQPQHHEAYNSARKAETKENNNNNKEKHIITIGFTVLLWRFMALKAWVIKWLKYKEKYVLSNCTL